MAHALDFTTGQAGIAYTGDTPWHGYGQRLDGDETLDQWRIAAGLGWSVLERPVLFSMKDVDNSIVGLDGQPLAVDVNEVKGRKVLVRSDTAAPLSVVSDRYHVVQPAEVMEFYRDLIDQHGFKMHTAGSLMDGRRIWALAETGKDFSINGDRVEGFLLLATSYDASMATTVQFTSVRVVCNNTLEFSMTKDSGKAGSVSISHNQRFDEQEVKISLGLLESNWETFQSNVTSLIDTRVDAMTAVRFFMDMMDVEAEDGKVDLAAPEMRTVKQLLNIYQSGPGADLATARDTAWGLVNAVTYFQDHAVRAYNNGTRMNSAWFGAGRGRKQKALQTALQLAA